MINQRFPNDPDCRPCDLKKEFNQQINVSSSVIIVIGDKTKKRTAGSYCRRESDGPNCACTPYKQNPNGKVFCKWPLTTTPGLNDDLGNINTFSYLEHEFRQAKRKNKNIIVVYNSLYKWSDWLPSYMKEYEDQAQPFWIKSSSGERIGNYDFIKKALGYE